VPKRNRSLSGMAQWISATSDQSLRGISADSNRMPLGSATMDVYLEGSGDLTNECLRGFSAIVKCNAARHICASWGAGWLFPCALLR
jgi:hypothetical protein